jgi:hypothetical protein
MNQLVSAQSTSLAPAGGNAFEAYGQAVSQRSIVGKLLKFSKGDYLVGENNEDMPEGTELIANMDELMVGWIKWQDNKPAEQIMGRVSDGYQAPRRTDLGDNNKDDWETDDQGQLRDPWQFSNYLILKEPGEDGELYTFATSSKGGLNAIGELCKSYGKAMRQRPDDLPVVTLKVGSYQHSNKSFGRIKFPIFELTGWAPRVEFTAALAADADTADTGSEGATESPKKAAAAKKATAAETRF